jgi:pimeloyl-ACP methyl ester carboxylesterase
MPFAETRSGRLRYEVCDVVAPWVPQPQTIVFHHGVAASLDIWARWLPVLASRYRLVRFDMRGYGESVRPPAGFAWSFDVLCDDILGVARACGAERFHLVGESIGGTAALAFALREPARVLSLTLSNAAARGGLIGNVASWKDVVAREGQGAWARQMMEWRAYPGALAPEAAAWWLKLHETCDMHASLALADMLLAADLTDRLGEIRVPTLLLSPDASPFIPLEAMVALRAQIPGAELQVFAHARHGLPLTHGDRCARVLRDFLARRCAG